MTRDQIQFSVVCAELGLLGICAFQWACVFLAVVSFLTIPMLGASLYSALVAAPVVTTICYLLPGVLSLLYFLQVLAKKPMFSRNFIFRALILLHVALLFFTFLEGATEFTSTHYVRFQTGLSLNFLIIAALSWFGSRTLGRDGTTPMRTSWIIGAGALGSMIGLSSIIVLFFSGANTNLLRMGVQVRKEDACIDFGSLGLYLPKGVVVSLNGSKAVSPTVTRFAAILDSYQVSDRNWKPPIGFYVTIFPDNSGSELAYAENLNAVSSQKNKASILFKGVNRVCYQLETRESKEDGSYMCAVRHGDVFLLLALRGIPDRSFESYLDFFVREKSCKNDIL